MRGRTVGKREESEGQTVGLWFVGIVGIVDVTLVREADGGGVVVYGAFVEPIDVKGVSGG
jgi:hypothetical protein